MARAVRLLAFQQDLLLGGVAREVHFDTPEKVPCLSFLIKKGKPRALLWKKQRQRRWGHEMVKAVSCCLPIVLQGVL